MAQAISVKATSLLKSIGKNPNIVLDIEGVDIIYGAADILELLTWDSNVTWDQPGITWDGLTKKVNARSYIDLNGTTKNIQQQISPDKQGSSSISTVNVAIIDKNKSVAKALSFNAIGEVLGRRAKFSIGFQQGSYPSDYLPVYRGVIVDFFWVGGSVNVTIANPSALQRQDIFAKFNTTLTTAINTVETSLTVGSTSGFFESGDTFTSLIRIEDELMEISSIDSPTTLTVIRSRENTVVNSHDAESEIDSFGMLEGDAIDLSLKLQLSNPDELQKTSTIEIKAFEYVSAIESVNNSIIFNIENVEDELGLVPGDFITVDGYSEFTISNFGKLISGDSYITVAENLTSTTGIDGISYTYRSKYNVLPDGLGMETFQVGVAELEGIKSLFLPNFIDYKFYLKDGMDDAKGFIDSELFYPSGLYSVPRNARASARFLSPPLSTEKLIVLDETNILNIEKLKVRRSAHKYLYNRIHFEYEENTLEEKFLAIYSTLNTDSTARIKLGKKKLPITSKGFRRNPATTLVLEQLTERFLSRYKFAAVFIDNVMLSLKTGFTLDVGDVVFLGGDAINIVDLETGERNHPVKKYEIINKKLSLDGSISVNLLDTGFSTSGLYGLFSPAAVIQAGSTATNLILGFDMLGDEKTRAREYFEDYIGHTICVRSDDYTQEDQVLITGLDTQNNNALITEALAFTPSVGMIVEFGNYFSTLSDLFKLKYTFKMRNDSITSVTSDAIFEVVDASQFFVGQTISIHAPDFTREENAVIDSISTNEITLTEDLSFTPVIGDDIEQYNYSDQDGYLFL